MSTLPRVDGPVSEALRRGWTRHGPVKRCYAVGGAIRCTVSFSKVITP